MTEPTATLHNGDCLDVLRQMPDASVDAVVTDPPWMSYETGRYDATRWHRPVAYVNPSDYAAECFRVLSDNSSAVLWCRWDCFTAHASALSDAGFTVKNCIVWAKPNHTAGDLEGNLANKHETAVFAVKGRWTRHGKRETNLWDESHLFSRAKRNHPTEKPVGLMRRSVSLCRPCGSVLDPFMGSGTTGVACMETGRNFIGIEIDPGYFNIAQSRVAAAQQSRSEQLIPAA